MDKIRKRLEKFCRDASGMRNKVFQIIEGNTTIQIKVNDDVTYEVRFFKCGKLQLQATCDSYKILRSEVLSYFGIEP